MNIVTKKSLRSSFAVAAFLLLGNAAIAHAQAVAEGTCPATGNEVVAPDTPHRQVGQAVTLAGSGFAPSCAIRVDLTEPNGAVSSTIVGTDRKGNVTFGYALGPLAGEYRADFSGENGVPLSSIFVTGGPFITATTGDKAGRTMVIAGAGFAPLSRLGALVTSPDEPADTFAITTDSQGRFQSRHPLAGLSDSRSVTVLGQDGTTLATTSLVSSSIFAGNFGTADHAAGFVSTITIRNNGTTIAPAGSSIIVAFSSGGANPGGGVANCTDTQGNAYTVDVNLPSASNTRALAICSAIDITKPLGVTDTITVEFPRNGNGQHATANIFTGLASSGALDQVHTAAGNSNAPGSGDTATTSQADELLIGAFAFNGTNANTFSAGAGYAVTSASQGAGGNTGLGSEYQVVSSAEPYSATGSLTVATAWRAAIATYRIQPADHLTISVPASATAGVPFSVTVTALDAANNVLTSYRGTVHFAATDTASGVVLPADYTFMATDAGAHTFTFAVTLVTAGSQTITATDTAIASITGTSHVGVVAANATRFVVSAPPSVDETPFNFTVTALDQFNNVARGYTGTVHFSSTDVRAILPMEYTFLAGDAGSKTFSATLETAGIQNITVTDTATSTITGTSNPINVSPC